jgi:hypothetical protein
MYDRGLIDKRMWHDKLILRRETIKAGLQITKFLKFNELANNV